MRKFGLDTAWIREVVSIYEIATNFLFAVNHFVGCDVIRAKRPVPSSGLQIAQICLHSIHGLTTTVRLDKKFLCFLLFQSVGLLSDALAIHTAMAVAIANGGTQRPQRPQRCSTGAGPKFKLIHEGDIQVCRLNHSRTLISKVLSSKFLRRWEAHHVYLGDFQMYSATVSEVAVEFVFFFANKILITKSRLCELV